MQTPECSFLPPCVTWRDIFGNDNPVEVEIGPGKGSFFLALAQSNSQRNFFAVELAKRRAFRLASLIERDGPSNAVVIHADMACLLESPLWPGDVAVYHLYFPDPWWKRRHHLRRLFRDNFAASLTRTLIPGGTIFLASDVHAYYVEIVRQFNALPDLTQFPWERDHVNKRGKGICTDFEQKYRDLGRAIFYARFRKSQ
ncbi:MAG: tRNA (guanosine(46)-N(7))-methyltransferase TrmB [Candidatus Binatia bacterium]